MRGSALKPDRVGTSAGTLAVAGRALGNSLVREAITARLVGTFSSFGVNQNIAISLGTNLQMQTPVSALLSATS